MRLVIYGGGGFAREVAWLCEQAGFEVCGVADDDPQLHGASLNGLSVMSLIETRRRFADAALVAAVGQPRVREAMMTKALALGFATATVVHPRVEMSRHVAIGPGALVCAGNILTTNITLGAQVQINLDCTIGHDVVMGEYTTLAPGVHVSGWVHFGRRVYVGTGAVFVNGTAKAPLAVGDDAVIGAGACVTASVASGTTVVGVPARPVVRA